MTDLDLLVMCANQPRHTYFATRLMQAFPNSLALIENHPAIPRTDYSGEVSFKRAELERFVDTEREYFREFNEIHEGFYTGHTTRTINYKEINTPENQEHIRGLNPKALAVHSTSIIKPGIINSFPGRILNLHAGLSPYYRGTATNLWPIYNNEPEYIGMTVHYLDEGIDSGEVISQGRPEIEEDDDAHTIGCKNVVLGTEMMIEAIRRLYDGTITSYPQEKGKGKLYKKREFTEEVARKIKENVESGLLREYSRKPKEVKIIR
tara:strand:- start:745 stop:1536 length:792 start_codon:yes stop_codon:yes gene_type:complete